MFRIVCWCRQFCVHQIFVHFSQHCCFRGPSGRIGTTVLLGCLVVTLALSFSPFGALFAALLLIDVILLHESDFLVTLTVHLRKL